MECVCFCVEEDCVENIQILLGDSHYFKLTGNRMREYISPHGSTKEKIKSHMNHPEESPYGKLWNIKASVAD